MTDELARAKATIEFMRMELKEKDEVLRFYADDDQYEFKGTLAICEDGGWKAHDVLEKYRKINRNLKKLGAQP